MRKLIISLYVLFLFLASVLPAFADAEDAILLGHHWESPKYLNEIYLQAIAMIIGLVILVAYSKIKRMQSSK